MKKFSFLLGLLAVTCLPMHAQMDASIKLNEVMTDNQSSLIDEYGTRHAWVEIANISHSTYNIRGMYLTTDRSVLDKSAKFLMVTYALISADDSSSCSS